MLAHHGVQRTPRLTVHDDGRTELDDDPDTDKAIVLQLLIFATAWLEHLGRLCG